MSAHKLVEQVAPEDAISRLIWPAATSNKSSHQGERNELLTEAAVIEREVKRRADVVGIYPSEPSIIRLIGAVLLEQNDEWQLQHRSMQVEEMAGLVPPSIEGEVTPYSPA